MVKVTLVPWTPVAGVTEVKLNVPACTAKPSVSAAVSAAVLRVTVRGPVVAVGLTVSETEAAVAELTVTELTVTPAPKSAVVEP